MLSRSGINYSKPEHDRFLKLSIGSHSLISRFTDSQDEFLHCHDFFEIIIIRYGSIEHCVKGKTYAMNMGDACIVAPNTLHSFKRKGECAHRDVMISETLLKSTCDFLNIDLYDNLIADGLYNFNISAQQIENFENVYYSFVESNDENAFRIYIKLLCCQLISDIYTCAKPASEVNAFKSKCITIIDENYADKNIMELLINKLGYTQGHFCKKFKNAFQITPVEYINRRRIISAGSTLILSNCTVEECCRQVGFDSLPHFIKLFKNHYGTTPTKYRRSYRLISKVNSK